MSQSAFDTGGELLSDDTDFLAPRSRRQEWQAEDISSLAREWRAHRLLHPIAAQEVPRPLQSDLPAPAHNPFEGQDNARRLSETVDRFLKRVPPIDCPVSADWIWITDPSDQTDFPGPSSWLEDCQSLMTDYKAKEASIRAELQGKAPGTITRRLTPLRNALKAGILKSAKDAGQVCGKWMLFPTEDDLTRVWRLICNGVVQGRLGHTAKVATSPSSSAHGGRLICVYTKDFDNLADVKRVLVELVDLGLERNYIYYKCDAFTYLGLDSGNEYGIRASLYSSRDLLKDN